MRDIEFRAWDEDLKKMFYSGFMVHPNGGVCMFDEAWTNALLEGGYVDGGHHKRKLLMQYTGRNDANGKKIFEGDKLRYTVRRGSDHDDYETTCDVLYDKERCGFLPFVLNDECEDDWYSFAVLNPEVIGNIHTNPELLEGKGNGKEESEKEDSSKEESNQESQEKG